MIRPPVYDPSAPIVVIDIGNSTIGVATWHQAKTKSVLSNRTSDQAGFERTFAAHNQAAPKGRLAAAAISSVVPEALERVRDFLRSAMEVEPLVVVDTIPFPMDLDLSDKKSVGADRVC